ncbi:hypothetical protein DYH09_16935 [bacterium CPR1]|nr:hypothetical protein [bacterium CPR1]
MHMESDSRKLLLIDGNGLAYRAFYAVPPTKTTSGTPTNAVVGFADMFIKLVQMQKPTHVAVAFDKGVPTERVRSYQDYNAQRMEMPEELAHQLPLIEDLIRAFGVQVYRVRGHEADDCIGTLSRMAAEEGMQVMIISGDLDLLQLVRPNVRVLTTRRGISDMLVYDDELVRKRFNLSPAQLADLRALAGDSSDNITGVPGIGEVTAKKLLSQHGSLEDLLNSLQLLPAKWRNPLSENRDLALDFKTRATIRTDLELDVCWEKFTYKLHFPSRVKDVFRRLEVEELLESLESSAASGNGNGKGNGAHAEVQPVEIRFAKGAEAKESLTRMAQADGPLSILWLGSGSDLVGLAVSANEQQALVVPLGTRKTDMKAAAAIELLRPALEREDRRKYVHNLRGALLLDGVEGNWPQSSFFDVAVAAHQLDSVEGNFWLDEIGRRYGVDIPSESELLGRGPGARRLSEVPADELTPWAGLRVLGLGRLARILEGRLAESNLLESFEEIEMPMVWVAASMEKNGVGLDAGRLDDFSDHIDRLTRDLESQIFGYAGEKFDLESPKDLTEVLFDRMGLQVLNRPKNGATVGPELLVQVSEQHEIGNLVRDWRALKELRAYYLEALPRLVHPRHGWLLRSADHLVTSSERIQWMGPSLVGGAVATFNRLLAEVEELPNLSLRDELRTHFKGALIPRDRKRILLGVRYAQLDLRLAAHLSKESGLLKSFTRSEDAARKLASELLEVAPAEVDEDVLKDAREVALSLAGVHRLARRQGITAADASSRLEQFQGRFAEKYPQLKRFLDQQLEEARTRGWVTSLQSRRRPMPELTSRNSDIRDTAERTARGAAVQASAADLLKTAMVQIVHRQREGSLPGMLAMQLRDELIFEIEPKQKETLAREVARIMESVRQLDVPVAVEVLHGPNWAQPRRIEAEPVGRR